jgi:predicted DNA-binding transcriptional regulator YafY
MESGLAGPSLISKELGVGVSTAYRDLSLLEEAGLIESEAGKRTLSADGLTYLTELTDHL